MLGVVVLAAAVAAPVVLVKRGSTPAPAVAADIPGALIRSGPAVIGQVSLTHGPAGPSLNVPGQPTSIVTLPDRSKAYLLDTSHGDVVPVDLIHGSIGAPIQVGKLPVDEHLSPDGKTLYVVDNLSQSVIPIDTASDVAGGAHQLTSGVDGFIPAPSGTSAVVTVFSAEGQPGIIYMYDRASGQATPVEVGTNPPSTAFYSRDGKTVWIEEAGIGNKPGVLIPVDVASHRPGPSVTLGHSPEGGDMTPDGRLFVVPNGLDGTVSIVNLASHAVVATVSVGAEPAGAWISPDGTVAWVASILDRSLVPVDLRTDREGASVSLGNAPAAVALTKDAGTAWVLYPSSAGSIDVPGRE